jgi:hypothetical protein
VTEGGFAVGHTVEVQDSVGTVKAIDWARTKDYDTEMTTLRRLDVCEKRKDTVCPGTLGDGGFVILGITNGIHLHHEMSSMFYIQGLVFINDS